MPNSMLPDERSSSALSEKWRYSEFFWSVFSRIRTEYGRENTDQKNSDYGHFSCSPNESEQIKTFEESIVDKSVDTNKTPLFFGVFLT